MNSSLSNSSCSLTKEYVLPESVKMEMTLQIYNGNYKIIIKYKLFIVKVKLKMQVFNH